MIGKDKRYGAQIEETRDLNQERKTKFGEERRRATEKNGGNERVIIADRKRFDVSGEDTRDTYTIGNEI